MSSFQTGDLGREARSRKNMSQDDVLINEFCSYSTLSRIERGHQTPNHELLDKLMREVGIPLNDFFFPYFTFSSTEAITLCDHLVYCMRREPTEEVIAEAKRLLSVAEVMDDFKKGINRQFVICCKAMIYVREKYDPDEITALVYEGMSVTYTGFNLLRFCEEKADDKNRLPSKMLIFWEIELLYVLVIMYRKIGKRKEAERLTENMLKGIEVLPEDDKQKRKKLTKVLLTLSIIYIEKKEYEKALDVCERGYDSALKYVDGRYAPDFAYNKAVCLYNLNRADESGQYFKSAYFGYILWHDKKKAEMVKNDALNLYDAPFCVYGTDKLELKPRAFIPFAYGKLPENCAQVGEIIEELRIQANLTRKQLCAGICNESTLFKIERGLESYADSSKKGKKYRGIKQPSVYILEALMQRMGRNIDLYFHTFLSRQSFNEKQKRNEIIQMFKAFKYDEAEALLMELEESKDYQSGVNLQFVLAVKNNILSSKEGCDDKCADRVIEALNVTIPDFDMEMIDRYRLTYNEIALINTLAVYYGKNENIPQAVKILERLRDSINRSYEDESEKMRTYLMVLYNYSKYLGLVKRYDEALAIAEDCVPLGEVLAILVLGAKGLRRVDKVITATEKRYLFGLIKRRKEVLSEVEVDAKAELAQELLENLTPKQLNELMNSILAQMDIAFFFGTSISLSEINLTRAKKKTTQSGQS